MAALKLHSVAAAETPPHLRCLLLHLVLAHARHCRHRSYVSVRVRQRAAQAACGAMPMPTGDEPVLDLVYAAKVSGGGGDDDGGARREIGAAIQDRHRYRHRHGHVHHHRRPCCQHWPHCRQKHYLPTRRCRSDRRCSSASRGFVLACTRWKRGGHTAVARGRGRGMGMGMGRVCRCWQCYGCCGCGLLLGRQGTYPNCQCLHRHHRHRHRHRCRHQSESGSYGSQTPRNHRHADLTVHSDAGAGAGAGAGLSSASTLGAMFRHVQQACDAELVAAGEVDEVVENRVADVVG